MDSVQEAIGDAAHEPDAEQGPRLPSDPVQLLTELLAHRGWDVRDGQRSMVREIRDAIEHSAEGEVAPEPDPDGFFDYRPRVVDASVNAPVGTGKTLGYLLSLVPAIVRGERVVVATSTKGLQEQIVGEELPRLARDLKEMYGFDLTYALLKGKGMYPCSRMVKEVLGRPSSEEDSLMTGSGGSRVSPSATDRKVLTTMLERAESAQRDGDAMGLDAEAAMRSLSRPVATAVRASRRCAGKSEPWQARAGGIEVEAEEAEIAAYLATMEQSLTTERFSVADSRMALVEQVASGSSCIYRAAYARAMASQVVVLNTTLLVYEVMRSGRSSASDNPAPTLMDGVRLVVVDEAHHLPRKLAEAYSTEISFAQVRRATEDMLKRLARRYGTSGAGEAVTKPLQRLLQAIAAAELDVQDILDDRPDGEGAFRQDLDDVLTDLTRLMRTALGRVRVHVRAAQMGKSAKSGAAALAKAEAASAAAEVEGQGEAASGGGQTSGKRGNSGIPAAISALLYDYTTNVIDAVENTRIAIGKVIAPYGGPSRPQVEFANLVSISIAQEPAHEAEAEAADSDMLISLVPPEETASAPEGPLVIKTVPIDVSFFRADITRAAREPNLYLPPRPVEAMNAPSVMVLSSGTITTRTGQSVGMRSSWHVDVPTPFDSMRVRMCVPSLPEPGAPGWSQAAWAATKESVLAAGGRALLLTTSNSRLREFTEAARRDFTREGIRVLSQTDENAGKSELVAAFREEETSVLVGTMGFWEGVDVPGRACMLVVMDKMPFPMRDDPVVAAQRAWVESQGRNAFNEVDVDYASVMIAQGAGRLVRAGGDTGGVLLLDSRVRTKRYGPNVLKLLPEDWPMTSDMKAFTDWLAWCARPKGHMPKPAEPVFTRIRPENRARPRISSRAPAPSGRGR